MRTVEPGYPTPFGLYRVAAEYETSQGMHPVPTNTDGIFLYLPIFAIFGTRFQIIVGEETRGWWLLAIRIKLTRPFRIKFGFVARGKHQGQWGDYRFPLEGW